MAETDQERLERIKEIQETYGPIGWCDYMQEDDGDFLIEQAEKVPQWIPVSERLPGADQRTLNWSVERNEPVIDWLLTLEGKARRRFTHWMPLPSPPEAA